MYISHEDKHRQEKHWVTTDYVKVNTRSRSYQVKSGQVKLEQLVILGHMGSRHHLNFVHNRSS